MKLSMEIREEHSPILCLLDTQKSSNLIGWKLFTRFQEKVDIPPGCENVVFGIDEKIVLFNGTGENPLMGKWQRAGILSRQTNNEFNSLRQILPDIRKNDNMCVVRERLILLDHSDQELVIARAVARDRDQNLQLRARGLWSEAMIFGLAMSKLALRYNS